jgi:hypothetical protein
MAPENSMPELSGASRYYRRARSSIIIMAYVLFSGFPGPYNRLIKEAWFLVELSLKGER